MAADTVSSLYPDRPIRPLPKRRLRERLSPEVADSIQYPSAPQGISPLFSCPYNLPDCDVEAGFPLPREGSTELDSRLSRRDALATESDDEDVPLRRGVASRLAQAQNSKLEHERHARFQPSLPATSSVDRYGYESLENTNNKKKRKIPTTGDAALNGLSPLRGSSSRAGGHSTLHSIEEASGAATLPQHGPGGHAPGGQNVPGSGRGRYGRVRSGRSPLRALSDSTNNWAGRNGKLRPSQWASGPGENTGIISTAIANAEKLPAHTGQENVSLLHQQLPAKPRSAATQFTFTCDSQVPTSIAWSGSDRRLAMGFAQSSTAKQGHESLSRPPHATQPAPQAPIPGSQQEPFKGGGRKQAAPTRKATRRSAAKEYAAAARARRRETLAYNRRHPPKPEETWICHFCEYESIFGHPPEALVRQYEIKDRKQRQKEEQRRAQWERLKKGKNKGRKNSKHAAKENSSQDAPDARDAQDSADDHTATMNSDFRHTDPNEDYYDDEEDEEEGECVEEKVLVPDPPRRQGGILAGSGGKRAFRDGGGT